MNISKPNFHFGFVFTCMEENFNSETAKKKKKKICTIDMFNQIKLDYSTKEVDRHNTFSSYYYRLIEKGLANPLGLLSKLFFF